MNLISDTYTNRTFRPILFGAGIIVMIIALLLILFGDKWEPGVYEFLRRNSSLGFVSGFVPYLGNLAIFLGAFLIFKAKQRPSVATKDDIRRDGV